MSSTSSALRVARLTVRIGGLTVLNDVGFELEQGGVLAVIGPNGAGKTTLFNCITGQQRPTSGDISAAGASLLGLRPSQIAGRGVARTYQNLALFNSMTVRENLMLGFHRAMKAGLLTSALRPFRTRREETAYVDKVDEILDSLGLAQHADTLVAVLPQGLLKKVEMARAIAMSPSVLLMDEPAAGMNSDETAEFGRFIKQMHARTGISIVLVEHDMPFVLSLAERIIVLNFGELIASGTPDEIRNDPRVIEAYLGKAA